MHHPWLSHQPPSQSLTCLHFQWLPIAPRTTPAAKLHPCSCDQDPGHLPASLPYPMSLPSSLSPCPRYSATPCPQRFSCICQPLSSRDAPVPTLPALPCSVFHIDSGPHACKHLTYLAISPAPPLGFTISTILNRLCECVCSLLVFAPPPLTASQRRLMPCPLFTPCRFRVTTTGL